MGKLMADDITASDKKINVALVGASIGNGWKFHDLPERVGLEGFDLEFIPVFDTFDKSPAIDQLLSRENLPNVVIIKECSVYFPGDLDDYKNKIQHWATLLKNKDIDVVLATSVPTAEPQGWLSSAKGFVKEILGKPNKMKQLTSYNDWLREYSKKSNFMLLDLEASLRVSDQDRFMKPQYDRGDYVHLNESAYRVLDQVAYEFLLEVEKSTP